MATWIDVGDHDAAEVTHNPDGSVTLDLYQIGLRAGAIYIEGSITLPPTLRDALVAALASPEEGQTHA